MAELSRHRGRVGALTAAIAVAGVLAAWIAETPTNPQPSRRDGLPYTISKETTWITGPLRPDGAVDYVAALNARLSEGVTPENNAAVLLMKVTGAGVIEPEIREEFYQLLGVPIPKTTDGALQSYWDFLGGHLKATRRTLTDEQRHKLHLKTFDESYNGPWKREKFPLVAQWLEENEEAIDLIVEASQRPRMYIPVVVESKEEMLLSIFGPLSQNFRKFARILSARYMNYIGEGQIEKAQRDLLALHRLASLIGNGSSCVDSFVGSALDAIACGGDRELAQSAHATQNQLARHREDLAKLPPFASLSQIYDLGERYVFLDFTMAIIRQSYGPDAKNINPAATDGKWINETLWRAWRSYPHLELDWDLILKIGNTRYDEIVAALKLPTFAERNAALEKIEADFGEFRRWAEAPVEIRLLLAGVKPPRETVSRQFGQELAWMLISGVQSIAEAEIRVALSRQMTRIVLALAEYHREYGGYPADLSQLSPRYMNEVPPDPFTQKPLKYRPGQDGYLLYSVGPNGRDDRGKYKYDISKPLDKPSADDIALRVPGE